MKGNLSPYSHHHLLLLYLIFPVESPLRPSDLFTHTMYAVLLTGLIFTDAGKCREAPFSSYQYCNASKTAAVRAADMVAHMNLTEKAQMLNQNNQGCARLGVPQFRFGEALHGVMSECGATTNFTEFGGPNTGCATSFPHALQMACSFNRSLWQAVGSTVSTESRALANQGLAGTAFWSPDINLARDPRWGRSQEVPSEDPYLNGEYAVSFIKAFQEGRPEESKKFLKAVATAKHFQDYSCETCYGCDPSYGGSCNRGAFNAVLSMQDQVEYFWPAWRAAVERAGVHSIMCSYNAVNGVPSCGNPQMDEILRSQWGFSGFITSDCSAINDPAFNSYIERNYNGSKYQQAAVAIRAGTDFNCGQFYQTYLEDAVKTGALGESELDNAIIRVWTKAFELGLLTDDVPYEEYGKELVDSPTHRALALDAAKQAMVLLKNSASLLPLNKDAFLKNKTIALVGPHINSTQEMLSNYHGPTRCNKIVNSTSPWMVFKREGVQVVSAPGCVGSDGEEDPQSDMSCLNDSGFAAAEAAAKAADVAIVLVGLTPGMMTNISSEAREDEGWDRHIITLPGQQEELIKRVYAANKNTVVVLVHALQLSMEWTEANVPAILDAHYPGELGGQAIFDAIFGIGRLPAGRLTTTTYPEDFVSTRNISDMGMRFGRGITYRYYQDTPIHEFGFGLAYTTFSFKVQTASTERTVGDAAVQGGGEYEVKVTNTGDRASDVVVLGFVASADRGQAGHGDAAMKQLFDFARVHLAPGEATTVLFSVPVEALLVTDPEGTRRVLPGAFNVSFGVEGSAEGTPSVAELRLTGDAVVVSK